VIQEHKFGSFVIDGKTFLGDIKIIGSRVRYWDDRDRHLATLKDIKELVESKPEIIVIGTGNSGYLEVNQEVKDLLAQNKILLFLDTNTEAIEKYNQAVSENKKVAAIFHATC